MNLCKCNRSHLCCALMQNQERRMGLRTPQMKLACPFCLSILDAKNENRLSNRESPEKSNWSHHGSAVHGVGRYPAHGVMPCNNRRNSAALPAGASEHHQCEGGPWAQSLLLHAGVSRIWPYCASPSAPVRQQSLHPWIPPRWCCSCRTWALVRRCAIYP